MKLRLRVALTTAALMIPLGALFAWGDTQVRERAASDVLVADAFAILGDDARAQCEASPAAWARAVQGAGGPPGWPPPPREDGLPEEERHPGARPGPPGPGGFPRPLPPPGPRGAPRVHLYPFDASLRASVPWALPLDPVLLAAAKSGATDARSTTPGPGPVNEEALLRTPWGTGACAYVLAVRPSAIAQPPLGVILRAWGAPLMALVAALLIALGPVVARIRALAAKVRSSALRDYRDRIEMGGSDEIEELAAAFDGAAREVRAHVDAQERREQTLRDFLANTTHDVMTPLTVLQGHLASLRDASNGERPLDPGALGAAIDEASYIAALVGNLAVAARIEAGEPHLAQSVVDLGRLIERCAARYRPIARQHTVGLEHAVPETPLRTEGDVTFLEQAVGNVIFNAVLHNRAGGQIAIVASALAPGRFRIRVVDDGPRMTDEELALLASPAPDPARTRRRDGHGLGLGITRRVVELHAMKLVFSRAELGGLCVDIEGEQSHAESPG